MFVLNEFSELLIFVVKLFEDEKLEADVEFGDDNVDDEGEHVKTELLFTITDVELLVELLKSELDVVVFKKFKLFFESLVKSSKLQFFSFSNNCFAFSVTKFFLLKKLLI